MSIEWDRIQKYCDQIEGIQEELLTEAGDLEATNDTLEGEVEELKEKIIGLEEVIFDLKEDLKNALDS